LFGKKHFRALSGVIATGLVLASTVLAVWVAYAYFSTGFADGHYRMVVPFQLSWLRFSPHLSIDMNIILDPISVMMIFIVTLVSLMVHLFSLGYMEGEDRYATYFAYLNLFTFSMLGLVLSGNIFEIYIFWELVGCSSYLLIGYYFDRPTAVAAAKKAFIVTRFADLGFLIGILILSFHAGTLDFPTLIRRLTEDTPQLAGIATTSFLGISALSWGLVLVFVGGAGKSAGFRADPCGDDGGGRGIPRGKVVPGIHACGPRSFGAGAVCRGNLGVAGGDHCLYADRYQACVGLFDDVPDRVHDVCLGDVPSCGRGRNHGLHGRYVPFVYARLF
jgi:hypothetical protein